MGTCGCVYCARRVEEDAKGRPVDPADASHMDIFRRLAAVKNMHGTPGEPKHKNRG